MLGSVSVSNPTAPASQTASATDERVGRKSASTSRDNSPAGSRSNSRARDFFNKATHLGAPQDWAAQSLGTPDAHAVPTTTEERVGRSSRDASPAGSRSNSRAREILNKITHMGAGGSDWAAHSMGTPDVHTPPVVAIVADDGRVGRASLDSSPVGSRSSSRAREFVNKITHMGAGGSDWAAHSMGTPDLHSVANGEERTGRTSRGGSPARSPAGSRSQSRVRTLLDQVTHMGAGGSDWAAHSMGTPDVHSTPTAIKEEAVVV
ncbi:hypothetical protein RQP46_005636 [Phenoliferia psychrophenolica]